jgi:hypothetical protein
MNDVVLCSHFDGDPLSIKLPTVLRPWPEINFCEAVYHIASLWLWLSLQVGDAFVERHKVQVRFTRLPPAKYEVPAMPLFLCLSAGWDSRLLQCAPPVTVVRTLRFF